MKLWVIAAALLGSQAPTVGEGDVESRVRSVLPKPEEERWVGIPWRINLMGARLEAQRERKPLLIWVMDGHVLGCT